MTGRQPPFCCSAVARRGLKSRRSVPGQQPALLSSDAASKRSRDKDLGRAGDVVRATSLLTDAAGSFTERPATEGGPRARVAYARC